MLRPRSQCLGALVGAVRELEDVRRAGRSIRRRRQDLPRETRMLRRRQLQTGATHQARTLPRAAPEISGRGAASGAQPILRPMKAYGPENGPPKWKPKLANRTPLTIIKGEPEVRKFHGRRLPPCSAIAADALE